MHSRCIAIAIALGNAQNHDIPRKGQLCRPAPSFTNCVHDCSTGAATTRWSWQVNHPYVQGWWSNRLKCNCRLQLRLSWNEKVPKENFCDSLALGWATIIKLDQEWPGPERDQECQSQDFSEKDFANPRFVGFFRDGIFQWFFSYTGWPAFCHDKKNNKTIIPKALAWKYFTDNIDVF